MEQEEINNITNEDYADLIMEYNGNKELLEKYEKKNCTIINDNYAVINIPVEEIAEDAIKKYSYSAFPKCYGLTDYSVSEATGVTKIQNIPNLSLKGSGVLIGIIDTGIDYTNEVFKNADNTTRIVSIWDQNIQPQVPSTFVSFGTEYTREQINLALNSQYPMEVVQSIDVDGHGTRLAGVAAGSKIEAKQFVGIAPETEFVVVKLKPAKPYLKEFFIIPENAVCYQDTDIMFGVRYVTDVSKKLNRPIVICIGMGTSSGFHDGKDPLSRYLSFVGDTPGTAVVVAAGNEGNRASHYFGTIDKNIGYDTVELNIGKDVSGFTMELWGVDPNLYSVEVQSPGGEVFSRIPARMGESRKISFIFEKTIIYIDYQLFEVKNGQLILFRMKNPTEGIWRFRVFGKGNQKMDFNIWLPMERFLPTETFFIKPNPNTTLLTPGNSDLLLVVTTYNHVSGQLFLNASHGYTGNNIIKPDITAPGVDVYSPGLNNTFALSTGSSVAAAITSGVAAMMLEWGIIKNNLYTMSTYEIINILIRGAKRNTDLFYPNNEWGYGILDLFNSFLVFRGEV